MRLAGGGGEACSPPCDGKGDAGGRMAGGAMRGTRDERPGEVSSCADADVDTLEKIN